MSISQKMNPVFPYHFHKLDFIQIRQKVASNTSNPYPFLIENTNTKKANVKYDESNITTVCIVSFSMVNLVGLIHL